MVLYNFFEFQPSPSLGQLAMLIGLDPLPTSNKPLLFLENPTKSSLFPENVTFFDILVGNTVRLPITNISPDTLSEYFSRKIIRHYNNRSTRSTNEFRCFQFCLNCFPTISDAGNSRWSVTFVSFFPHCLHTYELIFHSIFVNELNQVHGSGAQKLNQMPIFYDLGLWKPADARCFFIEHTKRKK